MENTLLLSMDVSEPPRADLNFVVAAPLTSTRIASCVSFTGYTSKFLTVSCGVTSRRTGFVGYLHKQHRPQLLSTHTITPRKEPSRSVSGATSSCAPCRDLSCLEGEEGFGVGALDLIFLHGKCSMSGFSLHAKSAKHKYLLPECLQTSPITCVSLLFMKPSLYAPAAGDLQQVAKPIIGLMSVSDMMRHITYNKALTRSAGERDLPLFNGIYLIPVP